MISTIYSGVPESIFVGSADLNGDGINGDLLPGTRRGSLGREVRTVDALNAGIRSYNSTLAGTLNARNQRLPFAVELPDLTRPPNGMRVIAIATMTVPNPAPSAIAMAIARIRSGKD